jgi:hypothetical protein
VSTINGAINSLMKVGNEPSVAAATQPIPRSAVVLVTGSWWARPV